MRKRVYISGPISKGNLANNINQGTAAFAKLAKAGFAPFCPMWSVYAKPVIVVPSVVCSSIFNRKEANDFIACEATILGSREMTHDDWMGIDLPWVVASDIVLRLPGESKGADLEVLTAEDYGIPVYYDIDELIREEGTNNE